MSEKQTYLLIGNGRLARHLSHYFSLLSIPYLHWYRQSGDPISPLLKQAEKAILCISDDSIQAFINEHLQENPDLQWISTSGVLTIPQAQSAHPLMTFADELYPLEVYQSIWFVTEAGKPSFEQLFPELPNRSKSIAPELKALYHAWTSLAGNCTSFLWDNYRHRLGSQFDLPPEAMEPYLKAIMKNIIESDTPLTGPLAREDYGTIESHFQSLKGDPFEKLYRAFVKTYQINEDESK